MKTLAAILQPLHERSEHQLVERARQQFQGDVDEFSKLLLEYSSLAPRAKGEFLVRNGLSSNDDASSTGSTLSLAISEATGVFLRNMVLAMRPNVVVELGSSCGVSTLYLADALRTLGQGRLIATELDNWKVEQLTLNIAAAGLERWVEIRHGDVFSSLAAMQETVDLAFIDIWATGYLPAFKLLRPLLRTGSVVLADNIFTAASQVQEFKQFIERDSGFSTTTLDFESGIEFSVML